MEALLLLRWIKKDGIDALLREDNLASVVFGICVPSSSAAAGTAEVVESYSFDISFHQPSVETDFDDAQARESTGEFFQNLNGFRPGCSLSQMAPCKTQYSQTQTSIYSQASSQHFSTNFSLSQKHTQHSQSQAEMSQMASVMSQSIHQQVKKHRGSKIPQTRFLTLRVGLKKAVQRDELPSALKGTGRSKDACIHTSPVPGGNGATSKAGANGTMRVTPLGRIVEKGYSGLCVDVAARSRADDSKEQEQGDDKSVHLSQALPLTQPPENEFAQLSEEDEGGETKLGAAVGSQKAGTARASSQVEDLLEDKENDVDDIQVGGRAFAKPYKGKQYALADILDHRVVKSSIDGREVEEYKCSFRSDELKAAGQTKQWRKGSKMMSYHHMSTRVEEALKGNGGIAVDDVAKEAKVELVFVQEIASKSKASLKDKNNVGRTSRKRYKGNARG